MTQHGPRDFESVLDSRYTLTDRGWAASEPTATDKMARLTSCAHALILDRPELGEVPSVGALLTEHVRWSA